MYEVVVLSLSEGDRPGSGACQVRAPARACADALVAAGAKAETVTAAADEEIDEVLARLEQGTRLVVATAVDSAAQLRAVLRRMVRRWAPPPSRRIVRGRSEPLGRAGWSGPGRRAGGGGSEGDGLGARPADLPADRTVPDLPPLAVLPLHPAAGEFAARLGLPRDPAEVAAAALGESVRRLDLLRTDGPTAVTLDGALLGGTDEAGRAVPWRGRVEVDDALLSTGDESLLAGVVANAGGYTRPDGLPLVIAADPADGVLEVAVAVPVRRRWRRRVRVEVRRARGRAVTVRPVGEEVACLDDGIAGTLTRQRSWWVEPAAWAVYTG